MIAATRENLIMQKSKRPKYELAAAVFVLMLVSTANAEQGEVDYSKMTPEALAGHLGGAPDPQKVARIKQVLVAEPEETEEEEDD